MWGSLTLREEPSAKSPHSPKNGGCGPLTSLTNPVIPFALRRLSCRREALANLVHRKVFLAGGDVPGMAIDKNEGIVKRQFFRRCVSTAGVEPELRLEDQDSGTSLADHFRWNFSFHQPSIRPFDCSHDSSMRTPSRRAGAEVEKQFYRFSEARERRLLHRPVWMRERPIK